MLAENGQDLAEGLVLGCLRLHQVPKQGVSPRAAAAQENGSRLCSRNMVGKEEFVNSFHVCKPPSNGSTLPNVGIVLFLPRRHFVTSVGRKEHTSEPADGLHHTASFSFYWHCSLPLWFLVALVDS